MRWTIIPAATIIRPPSPARSRRTIAAAYLDAARAIEASGAQALWIQHEYGIYGGPAASS
jgi:hypothetical protein